MSLLYKRELEEKKENDIFYYHKEETKEKKKKKIPLKLSEKCNLLSSEISQKIRLMKDHSEILKKLNTYSLQKISKEYFRIIPYKSINIKSINKIINDENNRNNISKNTIQSNSTQSSILLNNNKNYRTLSAQKRIDKTKINTRKRLINDYNGVIDEDKIQKEKTLQILSALRKNNTSEKLEKYIDLNINDLYKIKNKNILDIDRFNDSFRIQMNNTCYKFIPHNHLKKLNNLQRDNTLVRKSMESIKSKFKSKMKDFTDKKLMAKKYNKIKEKFRKENDDKKRIQSAKIKSESIDAYGYKRRSIYEYNYHSLEKEKFKERLKKAKIKIDPEKNMKMNDSLIDKVLKKLNNSLNINNVNKYINEIKDKKIDDKYKDNLKETENIYFPVFKEANNCIQKFDINKMKKKYKIKENNKGFLEFDKDNIEFEQKVVDIKNKLSYLKYKYKY